MISEFFKSFFKKSELASLPASLISVPSEPPPSLKSKQMRETLFETPSAKTAKNEWLETDGFGGFAMGSYDLIPRRRYHSFLVHSFTPPTERFSLLSSLEVTVVKGSNSFPLSSFIFEDGTIHPKGANAIIGFSQVPWPQWKYSLGSKASIIFSLFMKRGTPATILTWRLEDALSEEYTLKVKPLLSARSIHSLHFKNDSFNFSSSEDGSQVRWNPYDLADSITAFSNGKFHPHPEWFEKVRYDEEISRGYDGIEDLAIPGTFTFTLTEEKKASLVISSSRSEDFEPLIENGVNETVARWEAYERERREHFADNPTLKASEAYLATRGSGQTIIAGYPWFADWGRDTFISIRGLCLAQKRFAEAQSILLAWSETLSAGMIPNVFPESESSQTQYNSVDASLWYVVSASEYIKLSGDADKQILQTIKSILEEYSQGTRFKIGVDNDGLLRCGIRGMQLTWMDAKVGDQVFTPRIGKPVEIQCLWINALKCGVELLKHSSHLFDQALSSFQKKFWSDEYRMLYDVVDENHIQGTFDASLRPNQLFAVGGLPFMCVPIEKGRKIIDAVEKNLFTPHGIRTLSPQDPRYKGRYTGSPSERDASYHEGIAWFWLTGAFIEGWVRVRGETRQVKDEAKKRFLDPLLALAQSLGGHLPELADGDAPFALKGCPFQAWSVAETLRIKEYLS